MEHIDGLITFILPHPKKFVNVRLHPLSYSRQLDTFDAARRVNGCNNKPKTMPYNKHFRYKNGQTEIEGDNDIKAAVWLATLDRVLRFLWWPVILVLTYFLSG